MNNLDPLRPSPPQPPSRGGRQSNRVPPTGPAPRRPAIRGRGEGKKASRLSFVFSTRGLAFGLLRRPRPGRGMRQHAKREAMERKKGNPSSPTEAERGSAADGFLIQKNTLTRTDLGSGVITRRT
jgi:hypothetical protein